MIILPTSVDGSLMEAPKIIIYGYALVVVMLMPHFNKQRGLIALLCLFMIIFFTLISSGTLSGIRQFIPLVSLYVVLTLKYEYIKLNERTLSLALRLLLSIILVLGYLVIDESSLTTAVLTKYYAFGYLELAGNMYSQGKPILFFISHSIAAIAYTILFFITILWGTFTNKKSFYLLAVLLIPLIISLKSNTSYLSLFIIYVYVFALLPKKYKALSILITSVVIYSLWIEISSLGLNFDFFLGDYNNGFLSRYGSQRGVYATAIKEIIESPLIGTGLIFQEGQYKADSGIINELLRGGVFYFLLMKYLMYLAIFHSTNKKKFAFIVVIFFMIMEIAYAFTLSLRGPVMMLFISIYFNHMKQNTRFIR